jgi:hypothetical protein
MNLNNLPRWNDNNDFDDNEGESWKPNPTKDACKKLYAKWSEIAGMLRGALSEEFAENDEKDFHQNNIAIIIRDAYEVGAKIRSSETIGIYIGRMENAAIIRKNAQFIKSSLLFVEEENIIEKNYCKIIRNEIDIFRQLFKEWVATFTKDKFEDEWGLFV